MFLFDGARPSDMVYPRLSPMKKWAQKSLPGIPFTTYVIWSEWGDLDQRMRSELITDAYWEVFDDKGLALTVAMGLTPEEATRMGIQPA